MQIVSQSLQYDVNQIADTCRLLKAGEMSAEQLSNWAEHMYGLGSYCWHQFRMYEHNTNQSYFSTEFMDAMDEYLLVRGQWLSAHTNVEDHAIEVPLNLYEDLEYALNRIPNSIIDMDAELEGYCVQQLQEATRSMEAYVSMVEEST